MYKLVCGHQQGEKWYNPEQAEDCPYAVAANRRHKRTGALLRCTPSSTQTISAQGICDRPECYVRIYLDPNGWWCYCCGYTNEPRRDKCRGYVLGQERCRHKPCK
ncbi:uncharacterized protein BKA55DRAFT_199486 [Fusarium redolens]|uniref:Uncharacterized protein n=1 Tax=Fusarium redolens TaxID=48865 RepID=A0A9P9G4S6_FUSRE|nr:uncharacterized protein BKA55DRAFT_199486 [Fusarium redolens]KAH7231399.1 hypothetical protein BKA55DRAFT_199486 [Fusarium redolens]